MTGIGADELLGEDGEGIQARAAHTLPRGCSEMHTMAEPTDDKNSEHDLPKNRQASDFGARTGAAAGSLGREVSIALPGAGSKFAPIENPPEVPPPPVMAFANNSFEAAADTETGIVTALRACGVLGGRVAACG